MAPRNTHGSNPARKQARAEQSGVKPAPPEVVSINQPMIEDKLVMLPAPAEERQQMIAEAAYYRALARGFHDGDMLMDWLDAEKEIDSRLAA